MNDGKVVSCFSYQIMSNVERRLLQYNRVPYVEISGCQNSRRKLLTYLPKTYFEFYPLENTLCNLKYMFALQFLWRPLRKGMKPLSTLGFWKGYAPFDCSSECKCVVTTVKQLFINVITLGSEHKKEMSLQCPLPIHLLVDV